MHQDILSIVQSYVKMELWKPNGVYNYPTGCVLSWYDDLTRAIGQDTEEGVNDIGVFT